MFVVFDLDGTLAKFLRGHHPIYAAATEVWTADGVALKSRCRVEA